MLNRNLAKCTIFGTGIFIISEQLLLATTVAAVSARLDLHTASTTDLNANGSTLLGAAQPFEALTKTVFSVPVLGLDSAIAVADDAAKRARRSLPQASVAELDTRLAEVHQASKSGDRVGLAISSIEAYRILVSAARPDKVPTAVNLMEYAGLRYDADFRARPIRWPDMKQAAVLAREQWGSMSSEIADPVLKATVEGAVADMDTGADQQNTFKARRSVQDELGLVDELEAYFSKR